MDKQTIKQMYRKTKGLRNKQTYGQKTNRQIYNKQTARVNIVFNNILEKMKYQIINTSISFQYFT